MSAKNPSDSDPRTRTTAQEALSQPADDSRSTQPPTPAGPPPTPAPPTHRKPWGWIAVAGLLAAGVIGLAIYAINLNSDLDDADAQIASQQQQIDQAQDTGSDVVTAAQAAYDDLSAQLGATQQDASQAVDDAAKAQDQAEQAAAEATDTAEQAQKQADAAQAKGRERRDLRAIVPSAFGLVVSGATLREGVEATVAELQALQPQCGPRSASVLAAAGCRAVRQPVPKGARGSRAIVPASGACTARITVPSFTRSGQQLFEDPWRLTSLSVRNTFAGGWDHPDWRMRGRLAGGSVRWQCSLQTRRPGDRSRSSEARAPADSGCASAGVDDV